MDYVVQFSVSQCSIYTGSVKVFIVFVYSYTAVQCRNILASFIGLLLSRHTAWLIHVKDIVGNPIFPVPEICH